jgi:hypothetical protein
MLAQHDCNLCFIACSSKSQQFFSCYNGSGKTINFIATPSKLFNFLISVLTIAYLSNAPTNFLIYVLVRGRIKCVSWLLNEEFFSFLVFLIFFIWFFSFHLNLSTMWFWRCRSGRPMLSWISSDGIVYIKHKNFIFMGLFFMFRNWMLE